MKKLTWLITGSSRGFGRALAAAALDAGHNVIATARKPEQLHDLVRSRENEALAVALDVTDNTSVVEAFTAGVAKFGSIDVVVNNAGYANIAPVETGDEEDFRHQFETNFWGVYNVSRSAVTAFKRHGGGTIVQFSSIGGRVGGTPGLGSYQAAKFAVDGFTRVLAAETRPLGVRFLVIEPGGFATDWAGASMQLHDVPAEYDATVGEMSRRVAGSAQNLTQGDPARAAAIIVRTVEQDSIPSHLILGAGAVASGLSYSQSQIDEATAWRAVSESADFEATYPVALPSEPKG
jgi:NAD(P)-dependent dehydrogenase (short-subunit alcohol dehydrogenase family)